MIPYRCLLSFTTRGLVCFLACILCLAILADSGPVLARRSGSAIAQNAPNAVALDAAAGAEHRHYANYSVAGAGSRIGKGGPSKQRKSSRRKAVPLDANPAQNGVLKKLPQMAINASRQFESKFRQDNETVGRLPAFKESPTSSTPSSVVVLGVGQGQGEAVGVGAMNREFSPTAKSQRAHHDGPDNSLDVGAADRKGLRGNDSVAADKNFPRGLADGGDDGGRDVNPGVNAPQPQPQVREPPVNQIGENVQHHLAPQGQGPQGAPENGGFHVPKVGDTPSNAGLDQLQAQQVREPPVNQIDEKQQRHLAPEGQGPLGAPEIGGLPGLKDGDAASNPEANPLQPQPPVREPPVNQKQQRRLAPEGHVPREAPENDVAPALKGRDGNLVNSEKDMQLFPQIQEPRIDQRDQKPRRVGAPRHKGRQMAPNDDLHAPEDKDRDALKFSKDRMMQINVPGNVLTPKGDELPAVEDKDNKVLKFEQSPDDKGKDPVKLVEIPPDHLEGVRMEQDGHLNRDYKKEIFFGHHEEFDLSDEEKVSGRLKIMFRRADTNNDNFLGKAEIQDWIKKNVEAHLDDAVRDNVKVFWHLDANRDGFVSWDEFYSHFLIAKGYILSAKDERPNVKLEIDDSEQVLKYKYRWAEADEHGRDNKLDIDEMMNFRHPEQSKWMIAQLIKEMIDNVDRNGDGVVDESEFVALPYNVNSREPLPIEVDWQEERRKEFRNVIDQNQDGKAGKKEFEMYFNPHNDNHAKLEADNLIKLADSNSDGKLSLEEVLNSADLFLGSKMINAKKKLHDEF